MHLASKTGVSAHSTRMPEGLRLLPSFIDACRQVAFLAVVGGSPGRTDLKRRVQHCGWTYDYRARRVRPSDYLGGLPRWLGPELDRLVAEPFDERPTQVIVNEYEPGQGISPHVDCQPCFGDVIASLSLGGLCLMTFTERGTARRVDMRYRPARSS